MHRSQAPLETCLAPVFAFKNHTASASQAWEQQDRARASIGNAAGNSLIMSTMFETRSVSLNDVALVTAHRKAMIESMGGATEPVIAAVSANFEPWVTRKIAEGSYLGWITEEDGRPVASAGLLILDWPPSPLDPVGEQRGYIFNVFVEPEYRRRGLARALVRRCLAEAHSRAIRIVALHASDAGRALYEELGFTASDEMLSVRSLGG
jgi:ribosomal protein S18 acetylase RimI-like enzyme